MERKSNPPDWRSIESKLASTDREYLLVLVKALYGLSERNQAYIHAQLGHGLGSLQPYKTTISQWIRPEGPKSAQSKPAYSIQKAKQAIADYKKSPGSQPDGIAELMTFYCEESVAFLIKVGTDDEAYNAALTLMFQQTLKSVLALKEHSRIPLLKRLDAARQLGQELGGEVADDFAWLWSELGKNQN